MNGLKEATGDLGGWAILFFMVGAEENVNYFISCYLKFKLPMGYLDSR